MGVLAAAAIPGMLVATAPAVAPAQLGWACHTAALALHEIQTPKILMKCKRC